ncbi:MAG: DUF2254 domain-containing protein [Gillisia sp.]|nr:DUF2254 domain-containing protein [Gillisia sp.]
MKQLFFRFLEFYKDLQNKIAFYPTVFALFGILFAFIMMYLENKGISKYLLEHAPTLVVNNGNTAIAILTALISGLISMIVFSFSMVMLLLSQASSNYSPRLLPGLISDKNHQVILGIYLATTLYCIFILFSIQPSGDKYQIPGFSVLLGILGTVISIYSFIYFIHNISQSIQINNILDRIYKSARSLLENIIQKESEPNSKFPSSKNWFEYPTEKSGYLQDISISVLMDICEKEDVKLRILPVKGQFILIGIPLFKSNKKLEETTVKKVLSSFDFARGELVEDNYVLAFKQITEIIIKAMSPGINDPGTAINGIDYLTELLALRSKKKDVHIIGNDDKAYIKISTVKFEDLLYNVMASIRTYCKHDIILIQKLLLMFKYLKTQNVKKQSYLDCIDTEVKTLLDDVKQVVTNKRDIDTALKMAKKLGLDIKKA